MKTLRRHSQSLWQLNNGVTTIEFALISPILMLVILGALEISLIFFATSVLEGATAIAARAGKPDAETSFGIVQSEINRLGAGLLKSDNLSLSITGTQGPGELVTYNATYSWSVITPFMSPFFGNPYTIVANVPAILEPE